MTAVRHKFSSLFHLGLGAFLAPLMLTVCLSRAEEPPPASGWRETSLGLFADGHAAFVADAAATPSSREARLGEALTLLQLQPRTDTRLRRAAALLDALLAESTADEIGANARYFRARLEQVHRSPADPAAAIVHYERLVAEHPGHPLAGQAVVKLAILRLYRPQTFPERAALFSAFTARAAELRSASARRDLHLALGEAALRLEIGEQAALDHFVAALDAGIQLRPVRADTLVRVGELASSLHQTELARRHYRLFLDEFQRDPRRLAVTQHLAALEPRAVAFTP